MLVNCSHISLHFFSSYDVQKQGIEVSADGSLVINSAMTRHNGTYTCTARTIAGIKTASANIFVKGNALFFYHRGPSCFIKTSYQ